MTYTLQVAGKGNISIADSKLNTTDTSLAIPGRNTTNYGLSLNQNLINLLQNFAGLNEPAQPATGQLWYDTNKNDLKIYNGSLWASITPAWDAYAGSHVIQIPDGLDPYYVTAIVSQQKIVAICSDKSFTPAQLPYTIDIGGVAYDISSRFPLGISQGLTLATENGNLFAMTGIASQAQMLQTARNITLIGDIGGNAMFNGTSDISITASLSNLNVAGTYNQVTVDNKGRVVSGNVNLGNADIITALGYTPLGSIQLSGDVDAQTSINGSVYTVNVSISDSGVTAGTYNSVTVDKRGIVVGAAVSLDLPQYGIIMWPQTYPVPTNFAICNGQTVTGSGDVVIKTPDMRTYTIGTTTFIMRIS